MNEQTNQQTLHIRTTQYAKCVPAASLHFGKYLLLKLSESKDHYGASPEVEAVGSDASPVRPCYWFSPCSS